MLDSAGIPLPATVDALLITLAVIDPRLAYVSAALAIAGSAAGCLILFYLARKGGQLYLEGHSHLPRAQKFRDWFLRYGLVTVFIPALLPVPPLPTKVFVMTAGALGVRAAAFALVVLAARALRYTGLAYLGSQLGEHSMGWLGSHAFALSALAAGLFVFLLLLLKLAGRYHKPSAQLG